MIYRFLVTALEASARCQHESSPPGLLWQDPLAKRLLKTFQASVEGKTGQSLNDLLLPITNKPVWYSNTPESISSSNPRGMLLKPEA